MVEKHHLTLAGLDKLKMELDDLKSKERERVIESLKEARSQGDLSKTRIMTRRATSRRG